MTWHWAQFIFRAKLHVSSLSGLTCTWHCIELKGINHLWSFSLLLPVPTSSMGHKSAPDRQQSLSWNMTESKLNVICLEVQDWGSQWFESGFVCWFLWGMSVHTGRAGSRERKCLKNGSLIHCQLHVLLDGRPGSFSRKILLVVVPYIWTFLVYPS